jgi:aminopeptidase-like protein
MTKLQQSIYESLNRDNIGDDIYGLAKTIFPICRSITGNGVRETLRHVKKHIDLTIHEVPSGTQAFDWTVPREWNIRDAWIKDATGKKIIDFKVHNLHVLNYSVPVHEKLPLSELKKHIYTMPDQPDLIPYRTSYYSDNWGFCMSHNQLQGLEEGIFEVLIDSDHDENGSLTYGEYYLPGETEDEFLFSSHVCHPSLANDNCSGISVNTFLAAALSTLKTRYSYRFIFAPGTIGSITWLSRNEDKVRRIKKGLIISCVGDPGGPTFKRSQKGNSSLDIAVEHVLNRNFDKPNIIDFSPYGYDERQYCSPAFDLSVGLLSRSKFGAFPEYHTSADNLDFIEPDSLATSFGTILKVIDIAENDVKPTNLAPTCEPNLGKRKLYGAIGGDKNAYDANLPVFWVLNQANGTRSLLDIAERAQIPFERIYSAAKMLSENGLLKIDDSVDLIDHGAIPLRRVR